tara:strand:- start:8479 stop:8889 length:411 start_codon:yes stop_codon:yes gene_type:complete
MISTNLYEKKRRDNIAEERIKNGKKAMMFAASFLFTSASGLTSSALINYKDGGVGEATLINQNDGFATGEIKNISNTGGFVILKFNLKQSGNITTQDEIKLLDNEVFDLGQFQGKIYEISLENTSTQPVLINISAM